MLLTTSKKLQAPRVALTFNGSTDYVSGSVLNQPSVTSYSFFAWALSSSVGGGTLGVFFIGSATGSGYQVQMRRDGSQWSFYHAGVSPPFDFLAAYSGGVVANVWTPLGGTWDGQNIRLYVGGVLRATTAVTAIDPSRTFALSTWGGDLQDNGSPQLLWNGSIGLGSFWFNVCLSADQMYKLSNGLLPTALPRTPPPAITFYPKAGATLIDPVTNIPLSVVGARGITTVVPGLKSFRGRMFLNAIGGTVFTGSLLSSTLSLSISRNAVTRAGKLSSFGLNEIIAKSAATRAAKLASVGISESVDLASVNRKAVFVGDVISLSKVTVSTNRNGLFASVSRITNSAVASNSRAGKLLGAVLDFVNASGAVIRIGGAQSISSDIASSSVKGQAVRAGKVASASIEANAAKSSATRGGKSVGASIVPSAVLGALAAHAGAASATGAGLATGTIKGSVQRQAKTINANITLSVAQSRLQRVARAISNGILTALTFVGIPARPIVKIGVRALAKSRGVSASAKERGVAASGIREDE